MGYVASTASAKSHATITLRVSLFGDFGYHDLYKQYEASHPNIDIKEDIQSYRRPSWEPREAPRHRRRC